MVCMGFWSVWVTSNRDSAPPDRSSAVHHTGATRMKKGVPLVGWHAVFIVSEIESERGIDRLTSARKAGAMGILPFMTGQIQCAPGLRPFSGKRLMGLSCSGHDRVIGVGAVDDRIKAAKIGFCAAKIGIPRRAHALELILRQLCRIRGYRRLNRFLACANGKGRCGNRSDGGF